MARAAVTAWIGLGANLGDASATLRWAATQIAALPESRAGRASSIYRSAPVGADGPDYLNAVLELHTAMPAPALLRALQAIETTAGRERPYRNAPRTLDLDLLTYGAGRIASALLTVPHPRLQERAFVLRPWAEAAPECVPQGWLDAVAGQRCVRAPGGGPLFVTA